MSTDIFTLKNHAVLNGRYEIIGPVGVGGFSILYESYDLLLKSRVAMKEYFPHYIAERAPYQNTVMTRNRENAKRFSEGLVRFKEEARRMVELKGLHNTVNVFGLFEENSTCYIVMEFLEGQSLLDYLRSLPGERFTDIADAKQIIFSVADALEYTHSHRLLHRDVSPDNIFLCSDGRVKLIDFGAARRISENRELSVVVKSGCTPPEQYRKRGRQGPWTDIYALGATFYRMLTGTYPESAPDRIDRREGYAPPSAANPHVPEYLDAMILRCLAYEPALRISRASEIKNILERERTVDSVQAARKKRTLLSAAAYGSCFACVLLFVVISFILLERSETLYNTDIQPCQVTIERPGGVSSDAGWRALIKDFQTVCPQIGVQFAADPSGCDLCIYGGDSAGYSKLTEICELNDAADEYYVTIAYDAEISYWNTLKSYENGLDMNSILASAAIPPEYCAESYEAFIAPDNSFCAYAGSVADFRAVQRDLDGMYQILPASPSLTPVRYSVKAGLPENQRKAAMRFLLYLSSERAQEILFIHNDGAVPAEEGQYTRFFDLNRELNFLNS